MILTTLNTNHILKSVSFFQFLEETECSFIFHFLKSLKMSSNKSIISIVSDVFYVEQSSNDPSLTSPNTPTVLDSTEMFGNETREKISISSIASPGPQIVTIDSDWNEPAEPYGFGRQFPIPPPNLNNLIVLPIQFSGTNGGSKPYRRWT